MTDQRGFDSATGEFYDLFGRKLSVGDVILMKIWQRWSKFGKVTEIKGDKIHYNLIGIYNETYTEPGVIEEDRTYNGSYGFIILEEPATDSMSKFKSERDYYEYIRNKYFNVR